MIILGLLNFPNVKKISSTYTVNVNVMTQNIWIPHVVMWPTGSWDSGTGVCFWRGLRIDSSNLKLKLIGINMPPLLVLTIGLLACIPGNTSHQFSDQSCMIADVQLLLKALRHAREKGKEMKSGNKKICVALLLFILQGFAQHCVWFSFFFSFFPFSFFLFFLERENKVQSGCERLSHFSFFFLPLHILFFLLLTHCYKDLSQLFLLNCHRPQISFWGKWEYSFIHGKRNQRGGKSGDHCAHARAHTYTHTHTLTLSFSDHLQL